MTARLADVRVSMLDERDQRLLRVAAASSCVGAGASRRVTSRWSPLRKGAVVRCRVGSEVVPAVEIDVVGENVKVPDGSGETRSFRVGYVKVVGDITDASQYPR